MVSDETSARRGLTLALLFHTSLNLDKGIIGDLVGRGSLTLTLTRVFLTRRAPARRSSEVPIREVETRRGDARLTRDTMIPPMLASPPHHEEAPMTEAFAPLAALILAAHHEAA